jgi:hypothetical protein
MPDLNGCERVAAGFGFVVLRLRNFETNRQTVPRLPDELLNQGSTYFWLPHRLWKEDGPDGPA